MTEPLTLAQRLLAGLKGVTPGPWKHYYAPLRAGMSTINEVQTDKHREPIVQWAGFDNSARPKAQHKRNAAHIARCSPENIRALAEAVILQSATIAHLSAELARARAERDRAALVAADEANRADAAEAALAERTKERDEARAERDELDFLYHEGGTMEVQLSKAEAERDRLREAATDFLNAMRFGKMGTKALAASALALCLSVLRALSAQERNDG